MQDCQAGRKSGYVWISRCLPANDHLYSLSRTIYHWFGLRYPSRAVFKPVACLEMYSGVCHAPPTVQEDCPFGPAGPGSMSFTVASLNASDYTWAGSAALRCLPAGHLVPWSRLSRPTFVAHLARGCPPCCSHASV